MNLDTAIRKVPNFPKPGILFYDITSIFTDPVAFSYCADKLIAAFPKGSVDGVIGVESRGFLMSAIYARECGVPLILARKKGKLPGETIEESYTLEYGEATLEMHCADCTAGRRYLIVDDLIATGGTLEAVLKMISRQGAHCAGIFSIVGLPFLGYEKRLKDVATVVLHEYRSESV